MLVPEAREAALGATAVVHDEARDDLVDQERVPAIEEEVKLSPLGGSLRGRREARREPGGHRSPADGPARSRRGRSATGFVKPSPGRGCSSFTMTSEGFFERMGVA